jgi:AcrR family transcriptional regulator
MDARAGEILKVRLGSPRSERRDAAINRQRILKAANRLIAAGGASALSMDAVATAAGVGKGTIFRRFGDRAGLTRALRDEYMLDFQGAFLAGPPPLGPGAPPSERLEAFMTALIRLQHEHPSVAIAGESPSAEPGTTASGPLHLHVRVLVEALGVGLHADVIATMLLSAVSPATLDTLLRVRGEEVESLATSVCALLGGLIHKPDSP